MTLELYPVVLDLVRKLSPFLPVLRARSATLALFHRVIGTLVRLALPGRGTRVAR